MPPDPGYRPAEGEVGQKKGAKAQLHNANWLVKGLSKLTKKRIDQADADKAKETFYLNFKMCPADCRPGTDEEVSYLSMLQRLRSGADIAAKGMGFWGAWRDKEWKWPSHLEVTQAYPNLTHTT